MLDDEVLEAGLRYAKLYQQSTGRMYLSPDGSPHSHISSDDLSSAQVGGVTVDINCEDESQTLFSGLGSERDDPFNVYGCIHAPEADLFPKSNVVFRGRAEANRVGYKVEKGVFQGVKSHNIGFNAETVDAYECLAKSIGLNASAVRAKRCWAESIGERANRVAVEESRTIHVNPRHSAYVEESVVSYIGGVAGSVTVVDVDSRNIGKNASEVTAVNANAHSIGRYADNHVLAINCRAADIGARGSAEVLILDRERRDVVSEANTGLSYDSKLPSAVKAFDDSDLYQEIAERTSGIEDPVP